MLLCRNGKQVGRLYAAHLLAMTPCNLQYIVP